MGTERVRNRSFLKRKFDANRRFFLGLFLDTDLIGIICGFPRDDYLLISEIAVDSRFRKRGFGRLLVKEFENVAKRARHARIHVGAQDKVIGFYKSLGYKPFLLIQFKEKDYSLDDFKKFNILRKRHIAQGAILEVESKTSNLKKLKNLRKKFPKAYFQYIFAKKI
jgi:N-acetylglutamate synthase-like GNAT family acetyltransferase